MANTINFNAVYDGSIQPSEHSEVITADHFGLNLSFAWNQVGDIGWQNFDEIAEELGSKTIRWPGGADGERLIYPDLDTEGNVTWDLDNVKKGNGGNTQSLSGALEWCAEQDAKATITIPTSVFGPNGYWSSGDWAYAPDFDPLVHTHSQGDLKFYDLDPDKPSYANFEKAIIAFIEQVIVEATTHGVEIKAFEIGNEYSSFFTANTYGQLAAEITNIIAEYFDETDVPDALTAYHAAIESTTKPDTLVQIRTSLGNAAGSTHLSVEDLQDRAEKTIEKFTEAGALEHVDGVISHFYYREDEVYDADGGANRIDVDYDVISEHFGNLRSLVDVWNVATGKELDWHFTEWNVNSKSMLDKNDPNWADQANYGMKQIAPLLEMFSAMVANGVDAAQIWSARNHATSVGLQEDNGDTQLQIGGHLMKALQEQTVGKEYIELGVEDPNYDAHFFADADDAVLFLSSRKVSDPSTPQEIDVNLWSLGVNVDTVQVTIGKPDTGKMDTKFSVANLGDFDNVPSYLEPDVGLLWTTITVPVVDGVVQIDLGSYEVAYVNLPLPDRQVGDAAEDTFTGSDAADHLVGNDGNDWLKGEGGDDVLDGGDGNDSLYAGYGNDVLIGGAGDDYLSGGDGADHHDGGAGSDYADFRDIAGGGIGVNLMVNAAWGKATGDTFTSIENIWGSIYNDKIVGTNGRNILIGGGGHDNIEAWGGNDVIYGGWGHDVINGGDGDDFMHGGHFNDTYTGGAGADTFVFTQHGDTITDFDASEGDMIQFDDALWGGGAKTDAELLAYASVVGGNLVFDFGGGHTLTLTGVTDESQLEGQMSVI